MPEQSRIKPKVLTLELILEGVAEYFGLTPKQLRGTGRQAHVNLPRQIAMYLMYEETQHSYPQIGVFLGGRDHTTILHGHKKIAALARTEAQLRYDLEEIRNVLYPRKRKPILRIVRKNQSPRRWASQ